MMRRSLSNTGSLLLLLSSALALLLPAPARSQSVGGESTTNRLVARTKYVFSARGTDSSTSCGKNNVVTSWATQLDQYWERTTQGLTDAIGVVTNPQAAFSGGVFTAPVKGVYYLSCFGRCETQACDVTVRVSAAGTTPAANAGTVEAAFGTDLNEKWEGSSGNIGAYWSSHGVEFVRLLEQGQRVAAVMESGQGDDCLYETSYWYQHFNAMLYMRLN